MRFSYTFAIVLSILFVTVGSAATMAAPHEHDYSHSDYPKKKVIDETFSLRAGGNLEVDLDDVSIHVRQSKGGESRVELFVAGPDEERAMEYFEALKFRVESEGNDLNLVTSRPNHSASSFWKRYRRVQVWAIVSVPEQFNANIRTSDGGVRVDALDGTIDIRTSDGDLDIRSLRGPHVIISTSDGDIEVETIEGGKVSISTSDGDVQAKNLSGDRVSIDSSDGDIEVSRIEAGRITVDTDDGDIDIGASGGELEMSCSDGDMRVRLYSDMEAELSTHDGDVELSVPRSINADLDLKGEDVYVKGGAKIEGRVSDSSVVGKLNDGGKPLRVRTRDGSIALRLKSDA